MRPLPDKDIINHTKVILDNLLKDLYLVKRLYNFELAVKYAIKHSDKKGKRLYYFELVILFN